MRSWMVPGVSAGLLASGLLASGLPGQAQAGEPTPATAELRWKAGVGQIAVEAPGEHVGGGPSSLSLSTGAAALEWSTLASVEVLEAVRFPMVAGPVEVRLSVSLCRDDGSACRLAVFEGSAAVSGRRGVAAFGEVGGGQGGGGGAGQVVQLLDFTAVWCPPCNRMSAEVFDDPAERALLSPFVLTRVDVDMPESWAQKDRYAVGGYPTVVAVDAAGNEVDRLVGYPGKAGMRRWLESLATAQPIRPDQPMSPAETAAAARRLAEAGRTEAAAALLGRLPEPLPLDLRESPDVRVARLLVEERPEDARWLLKRAGGAVAGGDWVYTAIDVLIKYPLDRAAVMPLLLPVMTAAPGLEAAGWLDMLAGDDPVLSGAALVLLEASLSGDPERDRGYWLDLAALHVRAGQPEEAVRLLREGAERWPEEFTFHNALSRTLAELGRRQEALAPAERAWAVAAGDQKLRAALSLAKLRAALVDVPGAIRVLDEALAAVPEPPEGVEVRTRRYREQVAAYRAEIIAVISAPGLPAPAEGTP